MSQCIQTNCCGSRIINFHRGYSRRLLMENDKRLPRDPENQGAPQVVPPRLVGTPQVVPPRLVCGYTSGVPPRFDGAQPKHLTLRTFLGCVQPTFLVVHHQGSRVHNPKSCHVKVWGCVPTNLGGTPEVYPQALVVPPEVYPQAMVVPLEAHPDLLDLSASVCRLPSGIFSSTPSD